MIKSLNKIRLKSAIRKGFTLAEVVIATTIFTMVSVMAVSIFVNIIRIQNRIMLENAIYEDGRFMMERIAREIRHNAIDYEEYYRKNYSDEVSPPLETYGRYFGCYAEQFYHPGKHISGADELGAECNDGTDPAITPGCIINKLSLDINTGQNPYAGASVVNKTTIDANAVCDENNRPNAPGGTNCDDASLHAQDQLFLINSTGDTKTFIARQKVNDQPGTVNDEYAVALLRLEGRDGDTDGIVEVWVDDTTNEYLCTSDFDCPNSFAAPDGNGTNEYLENSLEKATDIYMGFVPLTPLRTNITSLKFFIAPLEDPRKGFAETIPAEGVQQQPHITVLMTLRPAASEVSAFPGGVPTITLQTTISSRVYNEVKSYRGEAVCLP